MAVAAPTSSSRGAVAKQRAGNPTLPTAGEIARRPCTRTALRASAILPTTSDSSPARSRDANPETLRDGPPDRGDRQQARDRAGQGDDGQLDGATPEERSLPDVGPD